MYQNLSLLKLFQCVVISSITIINKHLKYYLLLYHIRFCDFYTIAITRLFNVITYNNNVTVQSGLPIFFVLGMTKFTYTSKYTYPKFLAYQLYFAKVFKVIYEQKTYSSLFTSLVTLLFFTKSIFLSSVDEFFPFTTCGRHNKVLPLVNHRKYFNKSNIMNLLRHYSSRLKKYI